MLMMWALKVNRSTTAAARRGSVKVAPHSLNGALEAQAIEARSSRSVMTWNSSSGPRGELARSGVVTGSRRRAARHADAWRGCRLAGRWGGGCLWRRCGAHRPV